MEQEKREIAEKNAREMQEAHAAATKEIESLSNAVLKYKTELSELEEFRSRKDDFIEQIKTLKLTVEQKEQEYQDNLRSIEKKVLQDKSQLKKEMLQKVHEAVSNFRKVADQQMAETTKRAIKENTAITSQLQKMSGKTVDLITENEDLARKLSTVKAENSLLKESEKQLAKRNISHQKVIQMLVDKLRETDKMLEVAYDTGLLEDVNKLLLHDEQIKETEQVPLPKETRDLKLDELKELVDQICIYIANNHEAFLGTPVETIWMGLIEMILKHGDGPAFNSIQSVNSISNLSKEPLGNRPVQALTSNKTIKEKKPEKKLVRQDRFVPEKPQRQNALVGDKTEWGLEAQSLPKKGVNMFVPKMP